MRQSSRTRDAGMTNTYHGGRKSCNLFPFIHPLHVEPITNVSSAPGLKFGFSGQNLAISFGNFTTNRVLVAYRLSGLDWQMSNITAGATHQFVTPSTPDLNATLASQLPLVFELRVTNWANGVQISAVHLSAGENLIKIPDFGRRIEFIGDSLTAGYSATYEAFSGFGCRPTDRCPT